MRSAGWFFCLAVVLLTASAAFAVPTAREVNVPENSVLAGDEDVPEVTARVARVSFLRGDAKVRHNGSDDWEAVTLNLPVVEGDEIATEAGARLEIQFDIYRHLRLDENSLLKVSTLNDGGIALSVSLGTISVRATEFDKSRSFLEIDAPRTTVALQKAGAYRIDAGKAGDSEIRVSITEGGEARIYSDTAGFTFKNNRAARVFIDGDNAGEWESADASRFTDEFDSWSLDRDAVIAKRLRDSYYNKYYDYDIYGADDLNDYGDWVYTSNYGYVWRPHRSAVNVYADWSPYRYGHWRWIPPYGWVWINDEPWGWATYHHGRWFYDAGSWYWSPYGYYRYSRSWWFPALVVINFYGSNVYWYPLPYHCGYYNYNWWYTHHGGGHHGGGNAGNYQTGGIKTIPTGIVPPAAMTAKGQTGGVKSPPVTSVPPTSVITVASSTFGTTVKTGKTPPLGVANSIVTARIDDMKAPQLPTYTAVSGKIEREIVRERPKAEIAAASTKVGAAPRQPGASLDNELRTTRVFGGRPPLAPPADTGGVKTAPSDTRPTGAVVRQPPVKQDNDPPVRQPPVYTPPTRSDPPPVKQPPAQTPPTRSDPPPVKQPPRYEPPTRSEPPPVRQPPRSDPPPVKSPPRSDPPPAKSEPRPPMKSDGGKNSKSD